VGFLAAQFDDLSSSLLPCSADLKSAKGSLPVSPRLGKSCVFLSFENKEKRQLEIIHMQLIPGHWTETAELRLSHGTSYCTCTELPIGIAL